MTLKLQVESHPRSPKSIQHSSLWVGKAGLPPLFDQVLPINLRLVMLHNPKLEANVHTRS